MNNEDFEKTLTDYSHENTAGKTDFSQISCELYTRLADKTFGYGIVSFLSVIFLLYILPDFYKIFESMYAVKKQLPSFIETLGEMFPGPGGFMVLALIIAFYAGGLGLFHSQRWGKVILIYAFTMWGLVISFEYLYGLAGLFEHGICARSLGYLTFPIILFILFKWDIARSIKISAYIFLAFLIFYFYMCGPREDFKTVIQDIAMIFLVSSPYIVIYGVIYLIYNAKKTAVIKMMSIINVLFTITNIYCIFRVCFETSLKLHDRHVFYLSIFFMAVILVQSFMCGREFIPYITNKKLWLTQARK